MTGGRGTVAWRRGMVKFKVNKACVILSFFQREEALCSCWLPEQTWHPSWSSYQFIIWPPVSTNYVNTGHFCKSDPACPLSLSVFLCVVACLYCFSDWNYSSYRLMISINSHSKMKLFCSFSLLMMEAFIYMKLKPFSFINDQFFKFNWYSLLKTVPSEVNLISAVDQTKGCVSFYPPSVTIILICSDQQHLLLMPVHLLITLLI